MTLLEPRAKKRVKSRSGNGDKGLVLKDIEALTDNQEKTMVAFEDGKHLLLHGLAGTGKTFLSIYLAIEEVLNGSDYDKVIIMRSVVPTRDMGYLPGNAKEKAKVYEAPYYAIFSELFGRGDAYEILKNKNIVEFQTTSFVRGITINNAVIVVDEFQNMTFQELNSIITRVGENARIIFCGDIHQDDLTSERFKEKTGLIDFMKILRSMKVFENIAFGIEDIVRSNFVKQYIIASYNLGFV